MTDDDDRGAHAFIDGEWERAVEPLHDCGLKMAELLRSALLDAGLRPHTVSYRVKERVSAARKVERKARANYSLGDITDLLGLRVITYFAHEVDRVAEVIEKEFVVDRDNAVDKRTTLDPDRFGYLSLHYVVRLGDSRLSLPEYKKFGRIRFEIQIRSILQHAWAEIEHDLGYKSEHAVPVQLRRRFSRLAGLLELADEEFAAIRHGLTAYTSEVRHAVRGNALNVPIDRDTMIAYIRESTRLAQLEDRLAASLGGRRTGQLRPLYAEARAKELLAVGFSDLNEIDLTLERDGEWLWRFVRNWFQQLARSPSRQRRTVNNGVMLLYVAVAEAVQRDDAGAAELLDRLGVGGGVLASVRRQLEQARREAAAG